MTSQSIFSTMEFTQQMNFLDETFGLSADLFAADLDTEGSILDLDLDAGLKPQTAAHHSLEDLLLADSSADPLGEEWMETVDLQTFLETTADGQQTDVKPAQKLVQETRKEGLKATTAFELLKALLTGQQPAKVESLDLLQPVKEEPAVTSPVAEVPASPDFLTALNTGLTQDVMPKVEDPIVLSPVAEVPNLDFSVCDLLLGDVDKPALESFEELIEIQPEISLDNGDVVEIKPQIVLDSSFTATSFDDSTVLVSSEEHLLQVPSETTSVSSPLSNDDIESMLSSGPSSPTEFFAYNTIDTSCLSDSSKSSSAKSSQVSVEDFTQLKSKSKRVKAKVSPYDSDMDSVSDKKQRKKMQNKNAATRYRVKKRQEKETLQEQEVRLSDKNKELREKVESLQREIQYMKELMNEINKAKRSKI